MYLRIRTNMHFEQEKEKEQSERTKLLNWQWEQWVQVISQQFLISLKFPSRTSRYRYTMEVQSGQGWTDAQLPPGDIFSFSPFFHHHLPPPPVKRQEFQLKQKVNWDRLSGIHSSSHPSSLFLHCWKNPFKMIDEDYWDFLSNLYLPLKDTYSNFRK